MILPPEDLDAAVAYAKETHRLAVSNYDNVWPWRWLCWWRVNRTVQSRRKVWRAWKEARQAAGLWR